MKLKWIFNILTWLDQILPLYYLTVLFKLCGCNRHNSFVPIESHSKSILASKDTQFGRYKII